MTTYLYAKHTYLGHTVTGPGYLAIDEGKFGYWQADKPQSGEIIDYGEASLAPGLVDTHVHGFGGYDFMDGTTEAVQHISQGLLKAGVTSFLATTLTASPEQLLAACQAIAATADDLTGARLEGIFLEGPYFTEAHKGAQNPAYLLDPDLEQFKAWQEASGGRVKKIALAPERAGALDFIQAMHEQGVVVGLAHTDASYETCCSAVNAGADLFIHIYNGMRGLHHREPGVVGAALTLPDVYAELICDGHHVHPAAARLAIQSRGSEGTVLITDCMRGGGLPEGPSRLGELDVMIKDGAARLVDGGSLAGSVLNLNQAIKHVIDWQIATPEEAIRMASTTPAESIHLGACCGQIAPGRRADVVVLDSNFDVLATYVEGECRYHREGEADG